jgi:acyl-CoA thioesterase I
MHIPWQMRYVARVAVGCSFGVVLATAALGCQATKRTEATRPRATQADPSEPPSAARADPKPAEPGAAPLVVFLGDSISAGYEVAAEQAFPARLRDELASEAPFRLVNAGVSGDTSAGGLRRVDWLLAQKPAVVVIELGGNDGLRGAPHAEIEQNLRQIIAKVRAGGARPLLLGIRIPPNYGAEYARGFSELYPRVASALEVPLVPDFMQGVAGVPDQNLPDGLHPTPEGHARLAQNVAPALRALLKE